MEFKITQDDLKTLQNTIQELDQLLTERISDLHQVKGGMQSRHAYIFYRNLVWQVKDAIDNVQKITPENS
jgi:ACT domain-containing protein